jgi:hypothetical protein
MLSETFCYQVITCYPIASSQLKTFYLKTSCYHLITPCYHMMTLSENLITYYTVDNLLSETIILLGDVINDLLNIL